MSSEANKFLNTCFWLDHDTKHLDICTRYWYKLLGGGGGGGAPPPRKFIPTTLTNNFLNIT